MEITHVNTSIPFRKEEPQVANSRGPDQLRPGDADPPLADHTALDTVEPASTSPGPISLNFARGVD